MKLQAACLLPSLNAPASVSLEQLLQPTSLQEPQREAMGLHLEPWHSQITELSEGPASVQPFLIKQETDI